MATIIEVRDNFEVQLQKIFLLDQKLAAERSALKRTVFAENRDWTQEEIERRREIAATRMELAESMEVLALDTVDAIETASDVDQLIEKIKAVNIQLQDDLEDLKEIEEYAVTVKEVAEGLVAVVDVLIELSGKLG